MQDTLRNLCCFHDVSLKIDKTIRVSSARGPPPNAAPCLGARASSPRIRRGRRPPPQRRGQDARAPRRASNPRMRHPAAPFTSSRCSSALVGPLFERAALFSRTSGTGGTGGTGGIGGIGNHRASPRPPVAPVPPVPPVLCHGASRRPPWERGHPARRTGWCGLRPRRVMGSPGSAGILPAIPVCLQRESKTTAPTSPILMSPRSFGALAFDK